MKETQVPARTEFFRGARESVPVLLGTLPFALVVGAQAAQNGLSVVEVPLMTGLNFAGGSEFAAIQLWTSPPHLLLIAAVTFLINSRHLLMGAALTPWLHGLPKRKVFPALFFMCDESWAMAYADARKRVRDGERNPLSLSYYLGVSASMYAVWVICTTLGTVIGPSLGDVESYGFGMAFPAVFLVLLRGMWKGFRSARPWLVSLVVAAVVHLLVPGAWYVAAGAVTGLVSAYCWGGDNG